MVYFSRVDTLPPFLHFPLEEFSIRADLTEGSSSV